MKTKLLAILLCVMLCVGTMPLTAAADTVYSVTYNLTNMTSTGPATVTQGNDLFAPLSTDDGYMMPDSVVVTVNGQELDTARYGIATVPFSGDVLILAEDVTGDIVITAEAIKRYDIHFIGEIYTARVPIPEGQSLNSYYRSPDLTREKEGHTFDGWFESTDGGETLADTPFDFDTVLTADVTLYPKWTRTSYSVTYAFSGIAVPTISTVAVGDDLYLPFTADDGYIMPEDITVTMDGQPIDVSRYSVDVNYRTGALLLLADEITGDIAITADGVRAYDLTFAGKSFTVVIPIPDGQSFNNEYGNVPTDRQEDGYTFDGWFESLDGGETLADTPFDFDTVLTADVTLYPKWTPIATDTPDDTPASPDTGDTVTVLPAVLLMAASLSVITVAVRRKIGAKRHG